MLFPALHFLCFSFLLTLNLTKSPQTSRIKIIMALPDHPDKPFCYDTDSNTVMASDIEKAAAITVPPPAYSPTVKEIAATPINDMTIEHQPPFQASIRQTIYPFVELICYLVQLICICIWGYISKWPAWTIDRLGKIAGCLNTMAEPLNARGRSRAGAGS